MRKIIALLSIVYLMTIFNGCSTETSNIEESSGASNVEEILQSSDTKEALTYTVTDMSGRTMEVEKKITKVFCTGPVANIVVYTIDSGLLVGKNWEASKSEKLFLDDVYNELPVLGGWYGNGNEGNIEEIIKADPDIIINAGEISDSQIEFADELSTQLNIPVVNVEFSLDTMIEGYEFLGELLSETERTDELVAYIQDTYDDIEEKRESIDESEKVTVYYAEGSEGLQTDPEGSSHAALISYVGGINIAKVDITSGYGRATVSIEQLIDWDPNVILVCPENDGSSAEESIMTETMYSTLQAVGNERVVRVPDKPFKWFDRPPSANRIIGIKWTANALYPYIYGYDMIEETKIFYELFYRCTLTDEMAQQLLDGTM